MAGFTDLRLNHSEGQQDESFWPSFTDIMMVVVMIFLITSATLILRNTELLRQITETEEAKKLAAEQAEASAAENLTLEERLETLQHQLSMARLQQLKTMEEKLVIEKRLAVANEKLAALDLSRSELDALLAESRSKSSSLERAVEALRAQLSQSEQLRNTTAEDLESTLEQLALTNQSLNELQQQYQLSRGEVTELIERLAASDTLLAQVRDEQSSELDRLRNLQSAQIVEAQEVAQLSEERLAELRAEYVDLKSKYDKLVRPARTTKGKYVVSVRYFRVGDQPVIGVKEPADSDFTAIDRETLDSMLGGLKERYTDRLYIKVIIPDDSNLSYNEAWAFTREMLSRYDYYHQDEVPALPVD